MGQNKQHINNSRLCIINVFCLECTLEIFRKHFNVFLIVILFFFSRSTSILNHVIIFLILIFFFLFFFLFLCYCLRTSSSFILLHHHLCLKVFHFRNGPFKSSLFMSNLIVIQLKFRCKGTLIMCNHVCIFYESLKYGYFYKTIKL